MLLSSEIQLFPDKSLVYQLVIFLVVAVALNFFVFTPIFNILKLRRSRTEGDRKKIENLNIKAENILKEYEEKMRRAKKEAIQVKESIRREGEEQGHRIVLQARQKSLEEIDQVKKEIEKAGQEAREKLKEQAKALAGSLAEKMAGRNG